jgi:hypothetical protein
MAAGVAAMATPAAMSHARLAQRRLAVTAHADVARGCCLCDIGRLSLARHEAFLTRTRAHASAACPRSHIGGGWSR